jgi:hypothetical protein
VEAELGEGFLWHIVLVLAFRSTLFLPRSSYLLVDVELPEDLSSIQEMRVVDDPTSSQNLPSSISTEYVRTSWHCIQAEAG